MKHTLKFENLTSEIQELVINEVLDTAYGKNCETANGDEYSAAKLEASENLGEYLSL
jgi:hypothetical protein